MYLVQMLVFGLLILAQDAPMTDLTMTGTESATFSTSDTNACYMDDENALNAQLTDPSSAIIISMRVLGTVGDHPAKSQLTALSLDGPSDDPFVNWSAANGTVTLDDVSADVPIESGGTAVAASTHGVRGHIEADMTSSQGSFHLSGAFACHSPM